MIKIALTEKRRVEGIETYIFPEDVYSVKDFHGFADSDALVTLACSVLKNYRNDKVRLYLNGGLTIEIAAVLIAASRLSIAVTCMHLNRDTGRYMEQAVRWKSYEGNGKESIYSLCANRHPHMPPALIQQVEAERIFDFSWQEDIIRRKFMDEHVCEGSSMKIYITGLTELFISALNVASDYRIDVTCMHYDIHSNTYIAQRMNS